MNECTEKYKIWAEIDLSALRHNYRTLRDTLQSRAPGCRVIAVVKANAYGHGAEIVSAALAEEGCGDFAVSCLYEAQLLKESVLPSADILILGYSLPEDVSHLVRGGIIQTVFSEEYAQALSGRIAACIKAGELPADAVLRIHLKLDTGMNRLGFPTDDAEQTAATLRRVAALPHLKTEGMFTHFACADTDAGEIGMTAAQLARFEEIESRLKESGDCPPHLHCCNSAAALTLPQAYKSAVRAGDILYGMSPFGRVLPDFRPVMTLKARIAHVHTLKAGESVSYGAAFTAEKDMRIATVPLGYADGFLRHFGGASLRLPDGTDAPIVGRICMDQCMIDVGDAPVQPGDPVTVFGGDDGWMLETLAKAGGTINYEITSILTPRVPRIPHGHLPGMP